jgi:hypothetical protein
MDGPSALPHAAWIMVEMFAAGRARAYGALYRISSPRLGPMAVPCYQNQSSKRSVRPALSRRRREKKASSSPPRDIPRAALRAAIPGSPASQAAWPIGWQRWWPMVRPRESRG